MKILIIPLFFLLNLKVDMVDRNKNGVEVAINNLTTELISKYSSSCKANVAILQFRTSDDKISRCNQLIQNQVKECFSNAKNFKVIEQYSINHLVDESGWNLESASSYSVYSSLNESIFDSTGELADVFVYGTVIVEGEKVLVSAFLIPNGNSSNAIKATVHIPVSDVPKSMLDD
ncbi:MAG: hypothetical protein AB7S48_05160 [Bacteroidales bacterium]